MNPQSFIQKREEFASLCKSGCPVHTYAHTYTGPNPITFYYTDEVSRLEAYQNTQPTFRLGYTSIHGTHVPTLLNLETLDKAPTHYTLVGATLDSSCAFIGYTPTQASALAKALGLTLMPYSIPLNTLDTLKHFEARKADTFTQQLSRTQFAKASDLFSPAIPHPITPVYLDGPALAKAALAHDSFAQALCRLKHAKKGGRP